MTFLQPALSLIVRYISHVLMDVLNNREIKCQGLNRVRQLAYHHPKVFGIQLHSVTLAITSEAR